MKKLLQIILIITIILTTTSCEKEKAKKDVILTTPNDVIEIPYRDTNPIKLGFYTRDKSGYHLINNEIHLPWNKFIDIAVFKVLPTQDKTINYWYMQDAFPFYWNKYENNNNYKIGFNITYSTNEGETTWNILSPSDSYQNLFNYVQLYMYDDVSPKKGSWYDHLEDYEMLEGVLFTSIKLCASVYIDQITSPIKLTVFSYKDLDDFDPITKQYRGNSYYTIYIHKTN